ncbi:hypothetical protein ACX0G9_22990 [Flavitalea flava]
MGCLSGWNAVGQQKSLADTSVNGKDSSGMSLGIPFPVRSTCKGNSISYYLIMEKQPVQKGPFRRPPVIPADKVIPAARKRFLQVHGNVLYDLNYRSNIDTPYAEREVYQHTVQSYLDITYKDHYPFRVFLTTRFSNSSLFRNFSDLNLQYNARDFNNKVRRQVQNLLTNWGMDSLDRLKKGLEIKEKNYYSLKNWLGNSTQIQRVIAEREDKWLRDLHEKEKRNHKIPTGGFSTGKPALEYPELLKGLPAGRFKFPGSGRDLASLDKADTGTDNNTKIAERADSIKSSLSSYACQYDSVKTKLDSLGKEIDALKTQYQKLAGLQQKNSGQAKKEIDQISSGRELEEKLKSLQVSDSSLPKGYQRLYSVKSFGIGRTMLDYSELSAKNISITGVQVEYTPSAYMALAVGTVDYRFRDYTLQNPGKGQYIGLVRYGRGKKEGNNIIATYYAGKRQLYNSYTNGQGAAIPNYSLMGFTLEGRYKVHRTTTLIAEVAKSSSPYYSLDSSQRHNILGSSLKMNERSNEAYSIKLNSFLPSTQSTITASYRHFGSNFQSFSLFTTGTEQIAWSVRVDQPFFRRHLLVTGSIRTNDFTNPLLNASYKSTTVFKSIQATLRLKKWPTLSAGYFPSSQITKIKDDHFLENLFYTLTGSISHVYRVKDLSLISMLLYTQFYNKVTDTNFVYFNTKNLLFSQQAFLGPLTAQLQVSAAVNTTYNLYVIDQKVDYQVRRWLSLGAGIKYNKQTVYSVTQLGYSANATVKVPALGEFRLMADKGFIPGNNKQLVENKVGRLTYLKVF